MISFALMVLVSIFSCSGSDFPTHQGFGNPIVKSLEHLSILLVPFHSPFLPGCHPRGQVLHHWENFDEVGAGKSSFHGTMHEVADLTYDRVVLRLNWRPSVHCRERSRCSSTWRINESNKRRSEIIGLPFQVIIPMLWLLHDINHHGGGFYLLQRLVLLSSSYIQAFVSCFAKFFPAWRSKIPL